MKTNVAVFFGGRSVEHEISIISAVQAMSNIDREKYNVIPVYMSKQSVFYSGEALCEIQTFKSGNPEQKADPVTFVPGAGKVSMVYLNNGLFNISNNWRLNDLFYNSFNNLNNWLFYDFLYSFDSTYNYRRPSAKITAPCR